MSYARYEEPYTRPEPHLIEGRNAALHAIGLALVLAGLAMLGFAVALFT